MNGEIKRKIDGLRDLLVGKIPVPTDQVKQITLGLIYKFMSDIDEQNRELGGSSFFSGDYQPYAWKHILDHSLSAYERVILYSEGLEKMSLNPDIPQLFRDIFKGAFLPFKDPATVDQFLKGLNGFEYQHSEDLGDAYEYLLSIMGSQGDAGQFRTPRHIIDFIVECVQPQKEERVLDPACGTAGFLVSAYKFILKENTLPGSGREGSALTTEERKRLTQNFVGYDISQDMTRISLVNMYLHQFSDPHIYEYDTLSSLERWDEVFDCILTNPPFMSPKGGIQPHNRFGVKSSRSEVLFVDYILEHLSPGGRAGVIVPEGIIFQSGNAYKQLRRKLVEEGYLYAVVSLPAGVFQPYSGVKTSILLIDRRLAQQAKEILFLKVEADGFDLGAQRKPIEQNYLPIVLENIDKYRNSLNIDNISKDSSAVLIPKIQIINDSDKNFTPERYKKIQIAVSKEWLFVELCSVAEISSGNSAPQEKKFFKGGKYEFFRTSDVGNVHVSDNLIFSKDKLNDEGIKGLHLFPKNTILFPKSGASTFLNHRALLGVEGYVSSHLATIVSDELKIIPKYLFYLLVQIDAKTLTNDQNYPSLRLSDIAKIKIPLPPLEVQRQIVAEIDGWQKVIDGARQVVVNWKPEIKVEESWPKAKLEVFCEFEYGFTDTALDSGDTRFIRITDIDDNGLLIAQGKKYINKNTENQKYILKIGDLLVARTGATYGKTLFFDSDEQSIFASYLIRLKPDKEKILNKFYWVFTRTEEYWKQAKALVTGGGQPQFNSNVIREIQVPLPPISIQKEIIKEVEEQQKGVEACRRLIEVHEAKIRAKIGEVWGD